MNRSNYKSMPTLVFKALLAVTCGLLLMVGAPAHADFTYTDGTFNNADWTLFSNGEGSGGNYGYVTATQSASGGDPGSYRTDIINVYAATPGSFSAVLGFNFANGSAYDPATQGAISSVDFGLDDRYHPGAYNVTGDYFCIEQGGNYYVSDAVWLSSSSWTEHNSTLQQSDFGLWVPSRPYIATVPFDFTQTPDFSSSGGQMLFGYIQSNANDYHGGSYTNSGDVDNFSVTVHSVVPEPGNLAFLVGILLVGSGVTLRRKNHCNR